MSSTGGAVGISSASYEVTESTVQSIEKDNRSYSNELSSVEEKGEVTHVDNVEENAVLLSHEEQFPIDPDEEVETQQFTFRAILVGCILGGVIAASKFVVSRSPHIHLPEDNLRPTHVDILAEDANLFIASISASRQDGLLVPHFLAPFLAMLS